MTATTRATYVPARINHTLAAYDWAISGICADLAEHRIDRAMAVVLLTMETEETAAELARLEAFGMREAERKWAQAQVESGIVADGGVTS